MLFLAMVSLTRGRHFPVFMLTRYKVSEVKQLTILDLVFSTLLLSNYPLPMELQDYKVGNQNLLLSIQPEFS